MKDTRIEILTKEGIWQSLELASTKAIKYNAVINQIGKVKTREINHTNTFSLPYIYANIQALGINVFNASELAKSMNTKFKAKYFVDNKILREGYLVINNTNGGTINVNFIDEALELLDKWGSMTYQEFLKDDVLEFPADFETAITELDDYDMDVTQVLTPLSLVGTRGYPIALFPNNLNAIGDGFQLDANDQRVDDAFNPYQSRPIWNVKAFFDVVCETFGYTPIFDDSVNWDNVENTYMVESTGNEDGESGTQTIQWLTVNGPQAPYYIAYNSFFDNYTYQTHMVFDGNASLQPQNIPNWIAPIWLQYFNWAFPSGSAEPWMIQNCVFTPNIESGNVGEMTFYARNGLQGLNNVWFAHCWKNPTAGQPIVWKNEFVTGPTVPGNITYNTADGTTYREHELIVDKAIFNSPPAAGVGSSVYNSTWVGSVWTYSAGTGYVSKSSSTDTWFRTTLPNSGTPGDNIEVKFKIQGWSSGSELYVEIGSSGRQQVDILGVPGEQKTITLQQSGTLSSFEFSGSFEGTIYDIEIREAEVCSELIGCMVNIGKGLAPITGSGNLTTMRVTEEYIPEGVVTFDDNGQYNPNVVDLRFAAPRKTIKDLLAAYMHKDGILMDIDGINKTVKFFNYGEYEANKVAGTYEDWSSYLLRHGNIKYDTDYGNQFGKLNRIGLGSPFPGNTYDYVLTNQGVDSKFKDFATDNNSVFKDITNVVSVPNTNNPYFEYTNEGLGLVEYFGSISGTLDQVRADGTIQGQFTGLPKLANVNFATLPTGVQQWYHLVDEAIKVEASFLVPIDVMNSLDMSNPIYVGDLGGYFIIEKIEEYIDSKTPVVVKMIKLIDDLRGLDGGGGANGGGLPVNTDPYITLSGVSNFPIPPWTYIYSLNTTASFYNYTPTTAYIEYRKLDAPTSQGGTYTGDVVTFNYSFANGQTELAHALNASLPILSSEEGYYEIQVSDDTQGIQSNIIELYLGDNIPDPAGINVVIETNQNDATIPSGDFRVTYNYVSHVPTSSVLTYQKIDFLSGNATGLEYTYNMPLTPLNGVTDIISPVDGAGYYRMVFTTDMAEVNPSIFGTGGVFIT